MGAIATNEFQQAFGIVGTITQTVTPFHFIGDIVYRKSDFTQDPGAKRSLLPYEYKIIDYENVPFDDSGTKKYAALNKLIGATCTDAPYSPATDQLDDVTTPFYYTIKRTSDNKVFHQVHETDLYTPALILAYVNTNFGTWWDL